MPLSMASESPSLPPPQPSFPANTKQAASMINGILTDVTSTSFSDKIMITITQDGRLAYWIHVPLDSPNPGFSNQYLPSGSNEDTLLPMAHLTPKTLLGGFASERETMGQLYATQIASAILARNPEEKRTVIIGFGLQYYQSDREVFYDTIELVEQCLQGV